MVMKLHNAHELSLAMSPRPACSGPTHTPRTPRALPCRCKVALGHTQALHARLAQLAATAPVAPAPSAAAAAVAAAQGLPPALRMLAQQRGAARACVRQGEGGVVGGGVGRVLVRMRVVACACGCSARACAARACTAWGTAPDLRPTREHISMPTPPCMQPHARPPHLPPPAPARARSHALARPALSRSACSSGARLCGCGGAAAAVSGG